MKKTNNFRKCPYCPHHQDKKQCCCRRTVSSRPKNKSKKSRNPLSAVSQINTTLPISVSNFQAMPSIMAQNSILRSQNDCLKRELSTHYRPSIPSYHSKNIHNSNQYTLKDSPKYPISSFPSTTLQSQNDTSRTHYLHDKLYLSNKKLQEVLLQLDYLSKNNKELNEVNTRLEMEAEQYKIENDELREQISKLKKKYKKLVHQTEQIPSREEVERLARDNYELQKNCEALKDRETKLRAEIAILENKAYEKGEGLSPEWVAHTSTKINALEKNISRLEEDNVRQQRSILFFDNNHTYNNTTKSNIYTNQQIQQLKLQLITAIKALKTQTQTFKFSQTLNELICTDYTPIISLVKSLCQSLLEPLAAAYTHLQKQLQRKLKAYEIKFQKAIQRMHNMVIKIQNDRLRARAFNHRDRFQ